MDFYEVLQVRRSVRKYTSEAIAEDSLRRIAQAVALAPSACNRQPWKFEVVLNAERRAAICQCYSREWLAQAPAIVLAYGDAGSCWKRLNGEPIVQVDLGIAMEHLVLAAAAEKLATCWICAYDVARLNALLGVPEPWSILAIAPLGHAAEEPAPRNSKPLEQIFTITR